MECSLAAAIEATARGAASGCANSIHVAAAAVAAAVSACIREWRPGGGGSRALLPLDFLEEALSDVAALVGSSSAKLGVGAAKTALRQRGPLGEDVARRLGKLSKARNMMMSSLNI